MKTIITICLLFFSMTIMAQDEIYLHTSTAGNIQGSVTVLDHPDLNNNPNANIFVMHNYGPNFTIHDIQIGTWYDGTNWTVINEEGTAMVADVSFNVFIADGASVMETTADGTSSYHYIDNTLVNNNPFAVLFASKYWNPFGVYNSQNYGFWFDGTNWILFDENLLSHPTNASYKVLLRSGNGSENFLHTATAANIINNWTVIDHPLLNGNPNAKVIAQHNWGVNGDPSNIILDKVIGVWYTGTNWAIYNEDQFNMTADLAFNVYITDSSLGIEDNDIEVSASIHPNPASDQINIVTNQEITSITIFNLLGQKVLHFDALTDSMESIDVAKLPVGTYLTTVTTESGSQTLKFVKN